MVDLVRARAPDRSRRRRSGPLVGVLLAAACSFNPATRRLQLTTVSEQEEIELGQQTDEEVVAALGLYEDERLSSMVESIGASLAEHSERPGLPWTFRVLDEPAVNAFALPGGYIYATRGLLVHLHSQDELAAVLGHEIGHVTARHGVVQLRKSRVARASVGLFRIIDPNLRHVGGIAAGTASLALLKHSRDDEYEADSLGLRYVQRGGYDPAATVEVFDVLAGVSRAQPSERVPNWLSTHPDPELRRTRMVSMLPPGAPAAEADPEYLARLDGVVYGPDPRDGFIAGPVFVHPRRGYRLELPGGWTASHDGPQVMALSEDQEALLLMGPAEAALEEFFADGSVERGEGWSGTVGGFAVHSAAFSLSGEQSALMGLLAYIDYDDEVLLLVAIGPAEGWSARSEAVAATFASFGRVGPRLRGLEPMRVRTLTLASETTLAELQERNPSVIPLPALALLNGVAPDDALPSGRVIKRVEGFNPATVSPPPASPPAGAAG